MAGVVKAMDTVFGAASAGTSAVASKATNAPKKLVQTEESATMSAYGGMVLSSVIIMAFFTDFDFSIVQMLSSFCMLWAFLLLTIKVEGQNSAGGVSSRMLEMWLLTLFIRLSSTLIKRGYLPEDKSGDYLYQFFDVCVFFVILRLVYTFQRQHRQTYQEDDDLHGIFWVVPPTVMLAVIFHPNLNRSMVFDTIWTTAQLMETFCMLPQLYMITKQGGKVETYTSQFVVLMFVSRVFAWLFWYSGYPELAHGYVEGVSAGDFNWAGYLVIGMSTVQVLVSADFMYYYVKATLAGRAVQMPTTQV
jgi:hypothetical protein